MSADTSDEKKNATNIKSPVALKLTKQPKGSGRDPRSRLFSDSSQELPRGILKNARVPTKRSASECVDDLSQIMADLNLDFNLAKGYCPYHGRLIEEDDTSSTKANASDLGDDEIDEGSDNDDDTDKGSLSSHNSNGERKSIDNKTLNLKLLCDCQKKYRDEEKPTKSVRFDERVYELRIASRLYDRRAFTKYRLSSRHHPLSNQNQNNSNNGKSKSKNKKRNKSNNDSSSTNGSDNQNVNKKQTKSQRAKQSKKAKKKLNSMKRDEHSSTDNSSDDQGYCSSLHSLSD